MKPDQLTDRVAELEAERDFLLRSLTDLDREHDAGDVDDHGYASLKDGYTARAADVLRALSFEARDAVRPSRRVDVGSAAGHTRRKRAQLALTIAVCVAVAAIASAAVIRFVAPRSPNGGPTGSGIDSIASKLAEARQLQATDKSAALGVYKQVLATDPNNAEARTYVGWLVANDVLQRGVTANDAPELMIAAVKASELQIDKAISLAPTYADPKCFKAIIRFRFFADAAGAKQAVDACVAANPPEVVRGLVENLKTDIDKSLAGG